MKKTITILSALILSTLLSARADVLSQWTFETSVPAGQPGAGIASVNFAAEVGGGIAFGLHAGDAVYSNPAGNGSVESLSSTLWAVGDFYQFQFSTTGFTGIGISFDQTSSGTGPRDFSLSFSVNGSPFTELGGGSYSVLANATPNPTWNPTTSSPLYSFSFDLSFAGVDNATTVDIRLANVSTVSASGGVVGTGGTSRVDNFTVYSPVPEPSTAALLGLGLLAGSFIRRRK